MIQGALLGLLGVLMGVFFGVVVALNLGDVIAMIEKIFNFEVLPKGIYLINTFPSDLRISDVMTIAIISFCLSLVATIYPSLKASKIHPAEALRHE
jgi:lipoprotein-releasing system permease protein